MTYPNYFVQGACEHEKEDSYFVKLFDHISGWSWVTLVLVMFI
jgi:hypothetical protein